jgi:hypothetical protein
MEFVVVPRSGTQRPLSELFTGIFGSKTPISVSKWDVFSKTTKSTKNQANLIKHDYEASQKACKRVFKER